MVNKFERLFLEWGIKDMGGKEIKATPLIVRILFLRDNDTLELKVKENAPPNANGYAISEYNSFYEGKKIVTYCGIVYFQIPQSK